MSIMQARDPGDGGKSQQVLIQAEKHLAYMLGMSSLDSAKLPAARQAKDRFPSSAGQHGGCSCRQFSQDNRDITHLA